MNKVGSRISSVFSSNSKYRNSLLTKFSRKGIYYRESTELTQLPERLEKEVRKRTNRRQAHSRAHGQNLARTRLLRTRSSAHCGWRCPPSQAGPRNAPASLPATAIPGAQMVLPLPHHPQSPKFFLVPAALPTPWSKPSVGASDWSSQLPGTLRK